MDIKIFLENNLGLFKKSEKHLVENSHYRFIKENKFIKEFKEAKFELEFKKNCIHSKFGNCIMLLLNGEINMKKKVPNVKFRKNLSLMNKLFLENNSYKDYYELRHINATCHDELAHSFKISKDKLPAILYLDTQNYLYETFTGEFNEENINEFFDKIDKKRFQNNKINAIDIKFNYKNCEKKTKIMDVID